MADDDRAASILGDWCERRDRGEAVDPLSVVRAHPDLAEELQEAFAALEVADLALKAAPVAGVAAAALENLGKAADAGAALARIRPGRYRDFKPIGAGGMGIVYLTLDTEINRAVALKIVRPPTVGRSSTPNPFDITAPPDGSRASATFRHQVERFLQEAWLTGALEHPGIVPIYELGRTPAGVPYYTMRYVKEVRTLEGELRKVRTLDERMALLNPFLRICDAIRYAHSRGVIHRDLKPANIGLGEFGEVVVLDWGLAKMRERPDLADSAWRSKIRDFREIRDMQTATSALGTPGYMSPEAALGEVRTVDEVSDVYSLGAILYEILTGRLPFSFGTYAELLMKLRTQTPAAPARGSSKVPEGLSRICEKALAGRKADRFSGARHLADAIRAYQRESGVRSEVRALIHEAQAAFEGTEGLEGEALLRQLDRVTGLCQRVLHHRKDHARARRLIADCKALRRRATEEREKQIERKAHQTRLSLIRREREKRQRMRIGVMLTGILVLVVVSGVFAWMMLGRQKAAREADARAVAARSELEKERDATAGTRSALESAKHGATLLRFDTERVRAAASAAVKAATAAREERDRVLDSMAAAKRRTRKEKSAKDGVLAEIDSERSARREAEAGESAAWEARDRALAGIESDRGARNEREVRSGRGEASRPKPDRPPAESGLDAAHERLRSRDPAERIAAVGALLELPGKEASKVLAGAILEEDPAVRAAAIRALGERGDDVSVRALRQALGHFAKDSDTRCLVLSALGTAGDVSSVPEIRRIAQSSANREEKLARAAIEALGCLRSPEAVEALMRLVKSSDVRVGGRKHADTKGDLHQGVLKETLAGMTGVRFRLSSTWWEWWRHAKRDWRPTPLDPPNSGREFRSDGWRFRIERPDEERWTFSRPEGAVFRIECRDGSSWVELRTDSALESVHKGSRSSESEYRERCRFQAGQSTRKEMEDALSETVECVFDEPGVFKGEPVLGHSLVGTLKDGRPVVWKAMCFERNQLLYALSWRVLAESADEMKADLDAILKSFQFLDPRRD